MGSQAEDVPESRLPLRAANPVVGGTVVCVLVVGGVVATVVAALVEAGVVVLGAAVLPQAARASAMPLATVRLRQRFDPWFRLPSVVLFILATVLPATRTSLSVKVSSARDSSAKDAVVLDCSPYATDDPPPPSSDRLGRASTRQALGTWLEPDGARGTHRTSLHVRVIGRTWGTEPQLGKFAAACGGPRNEPCRACRWAALDARHTWHRLGPLTVGLTRQ